MDKKINDHNHAHDHDTCKLDSGTNVRQTISEMDFERGIWYAAQSNDIDRVKKLLDKGASVSEEDSAGYMALHYAARAGHYDVCKLLLENGAKVNAITRCGRATALHRAAMRGHENIVRLLFKFGADLNLQDADGYTALHRAALAGSQGVWKILIDKTNLDIVDNNMNTALQLAKIQNKFSVD
ncbi:ankyrin repeat domain-containing protein 39-like isoform X1 [Microplitis mediator]|uniref:ankyrin repeat domain-containing protein 39-like isoform X1 n=1 Tax=Microplitis mediator TaxID=375433 RepID=UPI0025574A97|nr:ankyrin repeat domain-containing protein 39-like isoform X1 [Microplitis mediator]